jgi:hypothetical protein
MVSGASPGKPTNNACTDEAKQKMRTDLFTNDAQIADGVRIALAPLRAP